MFSGDGPPPSVATTFTSSTTNAAVSKKHHRVHPIAENASESQTTDEKRSVKIDMNKLKQLPPVQHTVVNMNGEINQENTAPLPSLQCLNKTNRSNSQMSLSSSSSSSSSSLERRPAGVIKRLTSASSTVSHTDEILPQTFLRRMSASLNINAFVPTSSSSSLPPIHDINSVSTTITDENRRPSTTTTTTTILVLSKPIECEICCSIDDCEHLIMCTHKFCHSCLYTYLVEKIRNGCPVSMECPHSDCKQMIHPDDIKRIVNDENLYQRYEMFMLRRLLQKMPDTRWCPYPNCNFALLAENTRKPNKFDCLVCKRPFCQRCSQIWHPNLTCELAASQRAAQDPTLQMLIKSSINGGSVRPCPRCKSPIEKLNDGSCNHIRCAICTCEFCWLCMKEVDNLHFITPTGCTFYGKHRWSKKKAILFLLLAWLLTPLIALLLIVLALPILFVVLPIVFTKKFYQYSVTKEIDAIRRFFLCIFVFLVTLIVTPFILLLGLLIGIPALLLFIYFYMPRRYISANF